MVARRIGLPRRPSARAQLREGAGEILTCGEGTPGLVPRLFAHGRYARPRAAGETREWERQAGEGASAKRNGQESRERIEKRQVARPLVPRQHESGRPPGEGVRWGFLFFFQAEDGIRDVAVTGVQTCALPISLELKMSRHNIFNLQTFPRMENLTAGEEENLPIAMRHTDDPSSIEILIFIGRQLRQEIGRASCRERV